MKISARSYFFVVSVLFIGGTAALPIFVSAQGTGLAISPLTFELAANPGDTIKNIVRVTNTSASSVIARVEVEDFAPAGESGEVRIERDDTYTFSLAKWVTVNPVEFVVEPGQFQPVEFTVSVPENAEPGGHFGTVLASLTGGYQNATGAAISQKVGSLVLLQVAGDVAEVLSVEEMKTSGFAEYGPVILTARFKNTGTVHLKPRGFITVENMFGKEIAKLDVPQKNVLPDSIRKIDIEFGDKWMFGKYTARLAAIYGSQNEPLSYSASFWVIPWKVLLAVGAGLLVIAAFFWKARRRVIGALRVLIKGGI